VKRQLIIGIAGASGVIYGVRLLQWVRDRGYETHLIMSEAGKQNLRIETNTSPDQVAALADVVYDNRDVGGALASGSFITSAMVIVPCTIKTLSGIANSYTDNLLVRAADVTLKERRKLVLVVRETPLHIGHLRLMTMAAEMGAHILPPVPSFYHHPRTIDDIINQTIGKIFDYLGIPHDLFERWGEGESSQSSDPTLIHVSGT
jgi:4-hydroxy-3-polyprenylbenzoate decarboxylase